MPVGTVGSVKGLSPQQLDDAGAQIILGNTYHLMLRPGADLMRELGGLHQFMSWDKPILTDSGGFQVFSLASGQARGQSKKTGMKGPLVTIGDDGVTFRSHLDGSKHRMRPEDSMQIQMAIGADIIMAFDQCPPGQSDEAQVRLAMTKTSAWLRRCMQSMTRKQSRLFGIVQGGVYPHLRREHVDDICSTDLFGYSIGGLSVGESKTQMLETLDATTEVMPDDKPRYLMGVGTPNDLLDGIRLGVDMFDCVMPTRNARNGTLFTSTGRVSIKRREHRNSRDPLDPNCSCYTCINFSKAYLHHLYRTHELLYFQLASLHNITYYLDLVRGARAAIEQGAFESYYHQHHGINH